MHAEPALLKRFISKRPWFEFEKMKPLLIWKQVQPPPLEYWVFIFKHKFACYFCICSPHCVKSHDISKSLHLLFLDKSYVVTSDVWRTLHSTLTFTPFGTFFLWNAALLLVGMCLGFTQMMLQLNVCLCQRSQRCNEFIHLFPLWLD